MGKPICAVPLPPELQRELPAGALLFGFDGELVFRSKNPNLNQEPRTYSLMPVADNERMYEQRWNGGAVQDTFLSVEHFHGHTVRMFFFYFPIPKSTTSELSDKLLPLMKQAAKQAAQSSQITQELYSVAEKIIPGKEPASGPLLSSRFIQARYTGIVRPFPQKPSQVVPDEVPFRIVRASKLVESLL